ncbi:hypothetical protein MMC19_005993 [Ptychographa xylographoides]|nr:hypothetical protein [Ptychographa xylographoides]
MAENTIRIPTAAKCLEIKCLIEHSQPRFRNAEIPLLETPSHGREELAHGIMKAEKRESLSRNSRDLTVQQSQAEFRVRELLDQGPGETWPEEGVIWQHSKSLDDLLFVGLLGSFSTVTVMDNAISLTNAEPDGVVCMTLREIDQISTRIKTRIQLDTPTEPYVSRRNVLGILLHEKVHSPSVLHGCCRLDFNSDHHLHLGSNSGGQEALRVSLLNFTTLQPRNSHKCDRIRHTVLLDSSNVYITPLEVGGAPACPNNHRGIRFVHFDAQLKELPPSALRHSSHDRQQLAQAYEEWFRTEWVDKDSNSLTDLQNELIAGIVKANDVGHQYYNGKQYEHILFTEFFQAFNSLFFCNALSPYTTIKVVNRKIPGGRSGGFNLGITEDDIIKGVPYQHITIWDQKSVHRDDKQRLQHVLTTLLHEMFHAFQHIYMCCGSHCNSDRTVHQSSGFTGHGPSWVSAFRITGHLIRQNPILARFLDEDLIAGSISRSVYWENLDAANREFCTTPFPGCCPDMV